MHPLQIIKGFFRKHKKRILLNSKFWEEEPIHNRDSFYQRVKVLDDKEINKVKWAATGHVISTWQPPW